MTTAMPEIWDSIVVGAGPSGSSAAAILGESNKRVLLLDKSDFPREKTCGDGITYKCLEPLGRLGLADEFLKKVSFSARGYSLFFSDGSELTVRRPAQLKPIAYVLPRYDFDQVLLDGALRHASVTFQPRTPVRKLVLGKDGESVIGVETFSGETLHARVVIDASGANSSLAVQAGAGNLDPAKCAIAIRGYYSGLEEIGDTIELYFDDDILPGYFWVFPTSPTSANVGCGTFQHLIKERKLDLKQIMQRFFDKHHSASRKFRGARQEGALKGGKIPLPIEHKNSRVRPGFIMIGDSGAFVDPITAEGISYALHSGIMAAESACEALDAEDTSAKSLELYDTKWTARFGKSFGRAGILTTSVPKEVFAKNLMDAFHQSDAVDSAIGNLALQYELMCKLKVITKLF
jgi:geranylgeranyl reductase family protein